MKPSLFLALLVASVTLTPFTAQSQQPDQPTPQTAAAPDPDSSGMDLIFIQEMRLWQALQQHDLVTLNSIFLPDFLQVGRLIQTREQTLANLNTCTLVNFKLQNHHVRVLSQDIAIIAYTGSNELVCGDSHLKGSYNATTTWIRRDGKWLVQIHTEMPIKTPTANP
jgi:uncharacterized protein (TIGR02246 family)